MHRFVYILGIALVLTALAPDVVAQQGTSELRGRVVDQQNAVLPAVNLVVTNEENGMFRETVSNNVGSYFLSAMIPGTYTITAELQGFKKYRREGVRLEVGKTITIDVQLEVGGIEEALTITAESPIVDLTSKEVGGYVQARELVDLPSFNRNFTAYLGLLPGVVASISTASFGADSINVNGQTVRNVNFTLDGSNNNDTFNLGNGGAQARIPVEAVQEFQLLTSQFDAQYGLTSGGIVNAVSKQGSNALHGSAFYFFQDDSMTAKDYFARTQDLDKPPTMQHQLGGTVGGPIIRDKAHFFASIERIIFDNGVTINVPARPEFNRTDFEQTRVWNSLVRFDHQINSNHTWGLRYLRESSPQYNQLDTTWTPTRAEQETDVDWTLVGTMSSVFGSNKVNTLRLSATQEDVFFGNPQFFDNNRDQLTLQPRLDYLSFEDQQSSRSNRRFDNAYAFDDTFAWFIPSSWGDHDIKFGLQYMYASLRFQNWGDQNGTFIFSHDLPYDAANPRSYPERLQIRVPGAVDYYMKGNLISGFVQDTWKATNRLTLSLGLRYDLEIIPIREVDNPRFASPDDYPIDKNNVAPRVGFTFGLDSSGKSALRGGFGIFYQRTPYAFLNSIFSNTVYSSSFLILSPANRADPGPSQGQFPTDPFLVNGPTVNRDLLNQRYPPGTITKNNGEVFFDNPARELAHARQYSIGYQRELRPDLAVSIDYIHTEQRGLFLRSNLNPGLRATTSRTAPIVRVDPNFVTNVWQEENLGFIDYNAVQVEVDKRFRHGFSVRGAYTWSRGRGNSDVGNNEVIDTQLLGDLRLDQMEGPTSVDRPHVLVISGTFEVPKAKGLKISPVLHARSGTTFSLTDSNFDLDRNGNFNNEWLPPGTYSGTGQDAYTVDYDGGRRGARGAGFFLLNLRGQYTFRLGGPRSLDLMLDVFNLTNRANFANPLGDRRNASTFLVFTSTLEATRTVQINARFGF